MPRARLILLCGLLVFAGAAPTALAADPGPPPGANDFSCVPSSVHPRPVVLAHGLGARAAENWSYISPILAGAGYCVFAETYGVDPRTEMWPYAPGGVIRMQRSSKQFAAFVDEVLEATGARNVDVVGHSEGTVMPRWYLEKRGGARQVKHFVALTPLWRGTQLAGAHLIRAIGASFGFAGPGVGLVAGFCESCPQFVDGSRYLRRLNRDGEAIPGVVHTNLVTRYDELVIPYTSGLMRDGGTNIVVQDICPFDLAEHALLAYDPVAAQLILNALDPRHASEVEC